MRTLITDFLAPLPATVTELTAYSSLWTYARTATNGTGIAVGPNGAQANATGTGISATANSGVAFRHDSSLPPDQWVQATYGPLQNTAFGMALLIRVSASNSWLGVEIRGNGSAYLWGSNAGTVTGSMFQANNNLTGQTFGTGDVFRLQLQGTTLQVLRAPAVTPTVFATLLAPTTWIAGGTAVLNATAAGGAPGVGAFQGSGTTTYLHDLAAGDFGSPIVGPTPPTAARGVYNVRSTNQP
jgi:hypothetical protein